MAHAGGVLGKLQTKKNRRSGNAVYFRSGVRLVPPLTLTLGLGILLRSTSCIHAVVSPEGRGG